jgi:O-antigen ligase
MNGLFLFKDSLTNKISYFHLMFFMASLPFDMFYSHLILISFTLHTLIHLNINNPPLYLNRPDNYREGNRTWRGLFDMLKTPLVLQSVFFVTLLSTIYTLNRADALTEWGRQLTIFFFPLLFCMVSLDLKKFRPRLFMAFALVCTITVLYLYIDALTVIRHYKLPLKMLFSNSFTNHNFSEPIGMHATFFSMQAALALVYLLSVLLKEPTLTRKLFYLACSCVLVAGLVQLCSKSVIITLIFAVNVAIPYFMLRGTKRWKFVIASASLSLLVIAGILNSGTFKKRYISGLSDDLSVARHQETTDSRLARWAAAFELIRKSPVIGYGAGSEIGLLHEKFYEKKLYASYLNNLNAHNEYLSFLIRSGIWGLLVYLATLGYGFYVSLRKKDLLFFTFMLLVAVVSVSENLLDVDKGIIFYAFFFSFFIFSNKPSRPRNISIAVKNAEHMRQMEMNFALV